MFNFGLIGGVPDTPPPFDGGLFVNGGFEDGIAGWTITGSNPWYANTVDDTVDYPIGGNINGNLYQVFDLDPARRYRISTTKKAGDGEVRYLINDNDSGIGVDAPSEFNGVAGLLAYGVFCPVPPTTEIIAMDNLRLVDIGEAV